MKRKKIVFIITDLGSFNNFLAELTYDLISSGNYNISVICSNNKVIDFEDKYQYNIDGLQFFYVPIPRGLNLIKQLRASNKIRKLVKKIAPDLVHVHFTTAIFTTMLLRLGRTEFWGTFHGLGFPVTNGISKAFFFMVELLGFLRLDKIILLNKSDYKIVSGFFRKKTYLYKSLGLGCNLDVFNPSQYPEQTRKAIKSNLSIEGQFILTYTGRFVFFKGFHIVARTFMELSSVYPGRFSLLLMGGNDPIHKTGLSPEEESGFFSHNDVKNIGFTKEVASYLSVTDVFFFPSKKEGMPVCITEALSMGIPVLTANSRGCSELVADNINGFLAGLDMSDKEMISFFFNKIVEMAKDNGLKERLAFNALNNRSKLGRGNFINESGSMYKYYLQPGNPKSTVETKNGLE